MTRELVLPADFQEYAWDVEDKGFFWLASALIEGTHFPLTFYDPVRLQQDVLAELESGRPFTATRLLVIDTVTVDAMRTALLEAPDELFE